MMGFLAVPTNYPVVAELERTLRNLPSDEDQHVGAILLADTLRQHSTLLNDNAIEFQGAVKIEFNKICLNKEIYVDILKKAPATTEQVLKYHQQFEIRFHQMEARILNLEAALADWKAAFEKELIDQKGLLADQKNTFEKELIDQKVAFEAKIEMILERIQASGF